MAILQLQVPLTTRSSTLLVENKLRIGRHLFRLVVIDDRGLQSDPMDVVVEVRGA